MVELLLFNLISLDTSEITQIIVLLFIIRILFVLYGSDLFLLFGLGFSLVSVHFLLFRIFLFFDVVYLFLVQILLRQ